MIRINLLPYREMRRAAHRQRFQLLCATALALALLLIGLGYLAIGSAQERQEQRNQRLQAAINDMDLRLTRVEHLRQQRAELLARKHLVETLQYGRIEPVRIFDELQRFIPDGVYLRQFKQSGTRVSLAGFALSGARVSLYMQALSSSTIFTNPTLIEVKSTNDGNLRANDFSLNVGIRRQEASAPATQAGGKP